MSEGDDFVLVNGLVQDRAAEAGSGGAAAVFLVALGGGQIAGLSVSVPSANELDPD